MKTNTFNSIATAFLVAGILLLLFADNIFLVIVSIACFTVAVGYNNLAEEERRDIILLNQQWEGSGND